MECKYDLIVINKIAGSGHGARKPEQAEPENTIGTQTGEAGRINLPASFEEISAQMKQLQNSCEELKAKCARSKGGNSWLC